MSSRERGIGVFVWLLGFILMTGRPVSAQGTFPRGEVFGGYSYASTAFGAMSQNSHGWGASLSGNFFEHFGFTADFGGHYGHLTYYYYPSSTRLSFSTYEYLFGPRFTVGNERLTAFAHTLVGVVNRRLGGYTVSYPGGISVFPDVSQNNFAMGFGGGMDVHTSRNVAIRLLQCDYIPVRERYYYGGGSPGWSHSFRLKTGVVFKF